MKNLKNLKCGTTLKLIERYLSNRNVNFVGDLSHQLPVFFGVPLGSCLGPLLFLVYINDLSNAHKSTEFVLFADKTNIFVKAKNKTLAYEKANTILKSVDLYMMTNKLHINMSKSCFIDLNSVKNSALPNKELTDLIQNTKIKRAAEAKFLGVTIDKTLRGGVKQLFCGCPIFFPLFSK